MATWLFAKLESQTQEDHSKTIRVRVGSDSSEEFHVNARLLFESSPMLKASAKYSWKEAKEGIIKLPEHNHAVFGAYVQWLYTGRLHLANPSQMQTWSNIQAGYLLAHYIQATDYQDTMTDAMIAWVFDRTPSTAAAYAAYSAPTIFDSTDPVLGAGVRKLLVDIAVWHVDDPDFWESVRGEGNSQGLIDFLELMVVEFARRSTGKIFVSPVLESQEKCLYHSHGDNPCYKSKASGSEPKDKVEDTLDFLARKVPHKKGALWRKFLKW